MLHLDRTRAAAIGLFAVSSAVYAATVGGSHLSLDVLATDFGSWHLSQTGTPLLDHAQIPSLISDNPLSGTWVQSVDGHPVIGRSPGVIAAALPAYWLFGGAQFSVMPAAYAAAVLTALAVTLLFLTLRRTMSLPLALVSTAVFGFTTPVWSVSADGMYPHTLTVLGICGMAWAASGNRWWLAGVFGGITLWGRLHAAVIVAVLGWLVAWQRRDPRIVVRAGLASSAFVAAMSMWSRWMYDSWNPTASYNAGDFEDYSRSHAFDVVNQLGFWVSPGRGILIWSPVVLLLLPALARSWRDLPDWSRALAHGGLTYCVLQGLLNRYSGGSGFYGYRLGLEVVACAAPALCLSAPRLGAVGRLLIGPVIGAQLFAISLGAISNRRGPMTLQPWHTNFFASRLGELGAPAWVMLVVFAIAGFVVARLWMHPLPSWTARSAAARRLETPAHGGGGDVSAPMVAMLRAADEVL